MWCCACLCVLAFVFMGYIHVCAYEKVHVCSCALGLCSFCSVCAKVSSVSSSQRTAPGVMPEVPNEKFFFFISVGQSQWTAIPLWASRRAPCVGWGLAGGEGGPEWDLAMFVRPSGGLGSLCVCKTSAKATPGANGLETFSTEAPSSPSFAPCFGGCGP